MLLISINGSLPVTPTTHPSNLTSTTCSKVLNLSKIIPLFNFLNDPSFLFFRRGQRLIKVLDYMAYNCT